MRWRRVCLLLVAVVPAVACGGGGTDPVAPPPPPPSQGQVASVTLSTSGGAVQVGESLQLTATLRDAANRILSGRTVTWSSSNPALASVSGGLVTGHYAGGPVTVTAASEGASATAQITVGAPDGPSVVETYSVLDSTSAAFLRFASQTGGDAARALGLAAEWATTDPRIERADLIDSTYLQLRLKSGMVTAVWYDEVGSDGRSVYRGGGRSSASGGAGLARFGRAANLITNKRVLICAAAWSEFYGPGAIEWIVTRLTDSGLGFEVTLLKDTQCDHRAVATFPAYGLVIIDTHGMPNAFMTGEKLPSDSAARSTEAAARAAIDALNGPGTYDRMVAGDLAIAYVLRKPAADPDWWKRPAWGRNIWVTAQFIRSLPPLPNTVVFGNMCYSGYQGHPSLPIAFGFIQPAFTGRGVISYYGYAHLDGTSRPVTDSLARLMEDSLTYALVVDGDSTGIAHLKANAQEFADRPPIGRPHPRGELYFRQFGAFDYGYMQVAIAPDTARGEVGKPVVFAADDKGTGPAETLYEWDFGDGTPKVRLADNRPVLHVYQSAAGSHPCRTTSYRVRLALYNNANPASPVQVATATATARIGDGCRLTGETRGTNDHASGIWTWREEYLGTELVFGAEAPAAPVPVQAGRTSAGALSPSFAALAAQQDVERVELVSGKLRILLSAQGTNGCVLSPTPFDFTIGPGHAVLFRRLRSDGEYEYAGQGNSTAQIQVTCAATPALVLVWTIGGLWFSTGTDANGDVRWLLLQELGQGEFAKDYGPASGNWTWNWQIR